MFPTKIIRMKLHVFVSGAAQGSAGVVSGIRQATETAVFGSWKFAVSAETNLTSACLHGRWLKLNE